MFAGKPVIGIAGGIGSGKSFVAKLFGELGCRVISSDDLVQQAYQLPEVRQTLRQWWGEQVFTPAGEIDRTAVASRVFDNSEQLRRLEQLLHPLVERQRSQSMEASADDAQVLAFVWDTPLLFETSLERRCDATVFVEAPDGLRQQRVRLQRGWEPAELLRREKFQWPLDRKRQIADYVISNTADAGFARSQVREVLSKILADAK